MAGLIFISHSSGDHADVDAFAKALREAFADRLRIFNTSSIDALEAGSDWREQLLQALNAASAVILWVTSSALDSREVAFEIGAAYAAEKTIVPCCVHISPEKLPWGLSQRQAIVLDSEAGWVRLADAIAELSGFPGALDLEPLRKLARRFEAPDDALTIEALGYTVEMKNRSKASISDVRVHPLDDSSNPGWTHVFDVNSLGPGESVIVFRARGEQALELAVEWVDVTGALRERRIRLPGTGTDDA